LTTEGHGWLRHRWVYRAATAGPKSICLGSGRLLIVLYRLLLVLVSILLLFRFPSKWQHIDIRTFDLI